MNAPLRRLSVVVALLFTSLLISSTWIQYVRAGALNDRPGNTRSIYAEYGRERGAILVGGDPVAESVPTDDDYPFLRRYPAGELYASVTGYFSVIYGAYGLERAMGDVLSGTADQLFYRRIGDLLTGEPTRGASLELTIDPRAQQAAWDALGAQRGAVVALDTRTGAVLAMVSKPSYDPNVLASHDTGSVQEAYAALNARADPEAGVEGQGPLVNRAIGGNRYPPGSVFKLVTAAAALSSGRFEPDSVLPGPPSLDLPLTSVGLPNSGGGSCGAGDEVSFTRAMAISCNTAFGYLGLELGADALREQSEAFGFGERLEIPVPVTASVFPEDPNEPQTAQSAIGQFDVQVTPMQVAMVSAAIANGGELLRPQLVQAVRAGNLDVIEELSPDSLGDAVDDDVAQELTDMMVAVVEDGTGTAAQIDGVQVAGKSGTAQNREGASPHAWFTSFAPADDPRVAVAVVVESGGDAGSEASGGRTAAPIARAVTEAVLSP